MAEHVQAALDQMVAPLRDLMERSIFSESEVKAIVARRRESEYLLRRLAARKADFWRYIEAEQTLERLRQLRTLQRKRDHRKSRQEDDDDLDENDKDENGREGAKKDKEKQHIGDVHVVQLVHLLFVRAIRKFRSDLSFHLQHAEWCKQQKSWTRLGRVYAEALQVFPRQVGLWIEAASHEFFGPTSSIRNARILLQRGLRLNEESEELWVEYFSLELHYAQTLKGRRQILQPSQGDPAGSIDEAAKKEYMLPAIILRNAIRAKPDLVHFRLRFMDTCKRFPNTDFLMESIQDSMKKDFASEPESWIARALYETQRQNRSVSGEHDADDDDDDNGKEDFNNGSEMERPSKKARKVQDDSVLAVLREALSSLQTEEMFLQSFRFVQDYRKELEHGDANQASIEAVEQFVDDLWKAAGDYTSPDLALEHCHYLIESGNASEAIETIGAYCTGSSSSTGKKVVPAKAWIVWASLAPHEKQKAILERALQSLSMDRPDYMEVLIQHFGAQIASDEADAQLFDTLQRIILLAPKTTGDILVADTGLEFGLSSVFGSYCAYLEHSSKKRGIQGARKVYTAVLFQSTVKLTESNVESVKSFVDHCLELEQGPDGDRKRLRRLYDKALEIFGGTILEDKYRQERNDKSVYA